MFRNRLAYALAALLAAPVALQADDTFLQSDDFKDGDEVVNVFLKEAEYGIMIEDFARNGQEFDWGWALTPGWAAPAAPAAEESKGGLRGRLSRRSSGPKLEQSPKQLGFSLADYKTAYVPPVANFAGIVRPEELEQIHEALVSAVKEMGLTPKLQSVAPPESSHASEVPRCELFLFNEGSSSDGSGLHRCGGKRAEGRLARAASRQSTVQL